MAYLNDDGVGKGWFNRCIGPDLMNARRRLIKGRWFEDPAGTWTNLRSCETVMAYSLAHNRDVIRFIGILDRRQCAYIDKLYDLRIEAITNRHGHVPDETLRGTGKKGDPTAGQLAHTANFAVEYKKGQADAWQMRKDGCSIEKMQPPRGGTDAYLQGWKDYIGGV